MPAHNFYVEVCGVQHLKKSKKEKMTKERKKEQKKKERKKNRKKTELQERTESK